MPDFRRVVGSCARVRVVQILEDLEREPSDDKLRFQHKSAGCRVAHSISVSFTLLVVCAIEYLLRKQQGRLPRHSD